MTDAELNRWTVIRAFTGLALSERRDGESILACARRLIFTHAYHANRGRCRQTGEVLGINHCRVSIERRKYGLPRSDSPELPKGMKGNE